MPNEQKAGSNWFDQDGGTYAQYRPEYPPELARLLSGLAPNKQQAVDVGCGTGQLTLPLADHFDTVTGVDPSEEQIIHAKPRANIRYVCAAAEMLPLKDGSAALVTVAQAAHWFDLPRFYAEARRIGTTGTVIALISYGVLRFESDELRDRFDQFYRHEAGPYWPSERGLVDSGYADIPFPFSELAAPRMNIELEWRLGDFLGYVSTWSAVRRLREAGHEAILRNFARDTSELWGDPKCRRFVTWPINMRLGVI